MRGFILADYMPDDMHEEASTSQTTPGKMLKRHLSSNLPF